MSNIYSDFISAWNWDVYDILSVYEDLFNRCGIRIFEYEDEVDFTEWDDAYDLQIKLKKVILLDARDRGIIDDSVDIDEAFSIDGCFIIHKNAFDEEECSEIVRNFRDIYEIDLDIS